ncbi:MAG: hypothetical protein DBY32_05395 [Phascolarctobacterium sp.]|nr:MAG: hypothetical protein DBY32_05395 [Phascolarctobacterium sp.]
MYLLNFYKFQQMIYQNGVVKMKGKRNLERAVILGLLLSTSVYSTAWADFTISEDGNTLISNGSPITDYKSSDFSGRELSSFKKIIIEVNNEPGLKTWSGKYNLNDTNVEITVNGYKSNSDGVHLTNWSPCFNVNSYTAVINANKSDALNLSQDATDPSAEINFLNAVVNDGNGIRANTHAGSFQNQTATITINKSTTITINADSYYNVKNPTAVYAGADSYYDSDYDDGYEWKLFGITYRTNKMSKGKGVINLYGTTNILTTGNGNYGIWAGKNGEITVEDLRIVSNGNNSYGLAATNGNLIYDTDDAENKYGSTVTLNGTNNTIVMGIINDDGSVTKTEGSKAIYADSQYGVVKSGDGGIGKFDIVGDIVAENGGIITLDSDEQNYLQGDIIAFGTESQKNANINLQTVGSVAYQGDALAANGGTVDVTLGNGSFWSGRADDYQDAADSEWLKTHTDALKTKFDGNVTDSGTVNMNLGTGSIWNVTGQSWVTNLAGDDSVIIMDGEGTGGYALHVGEISGSNTFVMNVRPDESGDMLYVKNGTKEQQKLVINNADEVLQNMQVGDIVRFATVANSKGGFENGEFADMPETGVQTFGSSTRISDAGMFNVDFDIVYTNYGEKVDGQVGSDDDYNGGTEFDANKAGTNYVDENYGVEGAQNVNIVRNSVTKENLSDAGKTIINMSRANYKNAIYMDRLNKRLGEARYINGQEDQGMWVRLRHDRIGQSGDFRSMNTMYELGYDVKQNCDNGERRIGMAIDYMRGSTTYSDIIGKGETKRYGLWLYDTWLGDKGHYADYVLKWGHLSNDFDITAKSTLENITGDYSNNVFSVSAEYGKKNDMGSGWYFEPQAQLQLARVTGTDYVSSQDTKVSVDGINSLIGRAGFRLGRDLNESSTVYLKADLLHEFLGDQTITAQDATGTLREEFENKGTWYDVGIGFAAQTGKNSYAFLDVEKSFGNDNDETYQINAGLQWTF